MADMLKTETATGSAASPVATKTEPAFDLTPPDPVPQVAPEKAAGLVPVSDEVKSKLDTKVDGFVADLPISDESEEKLRAHVRERGFGLSHPVDMFAGDATFHAGWTLHSAPGNDSATDREVMTIIYYADGALTTEPANKNQLNDLRTWFPGLEAGDVAATDINPVVYSR